jgi:hypothetical protein
MAAYRKRPREGGIEDGVPAGVRLSCRMGSRRAVRTGRWDKELDKALAHYTEEYKASTEKLKIHDQYDLQTMDLRVSDRGSGRRRYEAIQQALNSMGLERAPHQVQFHNTALDANAKHIYKDDYEQCLEEIYKRTGLNEIRHYILVQTPRRFGKTTMVAMLVAALIAFCPNIRIGIFSTSQRTSKKLLLEIEGFLMKIPGFKQDRVVVTNKEELRVCNAGMNKTQWVAAGRQLDQTTVVYSYSASAKTTRGFTVDSIVLEEAAHMSQSLWLEVVVPALAVNHTTMLAITTPQDPTNYFSRLLQYKRKDGSLMFLVQALGLACKACLDKNMASKCNHMSSVLPKWKSEVRHEQQRAIYGEENKHLFEQETLGLVVHDSSRVFPEEDIKAFADSPPYNFHSSPYIIWSFIDPSGGGTQSAVVVVSIIYSPDASTNKCRFVVTPPPLSLPVSFAQTKQNQVSGSLTYAMRIRVENSTAEVTW